MTEPIDRPEIHHAARIKELEAERDHAQEHLDGARLALVKEKQIRVGYQDIVYAVCNLLDVFGPGGIRERITVGEVVPKLRAMQSEIIDANAERDKLAAAVEELRLIVQAEANRRLSAGGDFESSGRVMQNTLDRLPATKFGERSEAAENSCKLPGEGSNE